MTGAVLAGCGGGAGGAGVVTPGPLAWSNIFGLGSGATDAQTLTAITRPISLAASQSGGGTLYVSLGGSFAVYAGPFSAGAGDTLRWTMINTGALPVSGVVTVTNQSDGGATLATFSYTVKGA